MRFFYPTFKNSVLLLLFLQLPLMILSLYLGSSLIYWAKFEAIALGIVCLWPRKPFMEMDECEKAVELKWKNRMLEFTYPLILIPIAILLTNPNANGWVVLNSFTVPVFVLLIILSILLRREQGGFFYITEQSSQS
jgi:hypothetical protein